jgi:hypothetical protein
MRFMGDVRRVPGSLFILLKTPQNFFVSHNMPQISLNKGHHVLKEVLFQLMREYEECDTSIHEQFL